jgi:Predicted pyridoxal phosphate-dependent enzyme apparently involved in regulation of cell wall biogenesis
MKISFSPPDITQEEMDEVMDTLQSGWITTGPKTKLFEDKLAQYIGTEKVVCMSSATASMEAVLRFLGVGEGSEVITSAYTFSATASVIQHVGAKIVLVDTVKNSFQMDYDKLESAITEKTKVIIPVDIAGVMCDYDRIFDVVKRKQAIFHPDNNIQNTLQRIIVMADGAHSFGATYQGKQSGSVADFTCFSFHAVKNLTTAEGGAITWNAIKGIDSKDIYREFMLMSLHGQSKDALAKTKLGAWEYDIVYPGYKSNMTDITASLGLVQLRRYPQLLQRRKQIIQMYNKVLDDCNVTYLKHEGDDFSSSGHLYLVRLTGKDETYRNQIIVQMAEKGIATNVHYKPLPMHTAYKKLHFDIKDFPNAFGQYQNEITLPLHTCLTDEEVYYVINSFREIIRN